jgi:enoyl-CoA hydratase
VEFPGDLGVFMVDAPVVRVESAGPVTRITLSRPEVLNALNAPLVAELRRVLHDIAVDTDCRVVILSGDGRAFCAGLDLNGYGPAPGSDGVGPTPGLLALQEDLSSLIIDLRKLRQPVIAAVNGAATGGGLALVLGSDIRLAAESARFGIAFMRLGLSACEMGTSWLLPRLVGVGRAHELMLSGRIFDAEEAARIGLVLEVVGDEDLPGRANEMAEQIVSANSPLGVWMTKQTMWASLDIPALSTAIELENRTQIVAATTADYQEAVAARRDRRPPNYAFS